MKFTHSLNQTKPHVEHFDTTEQMLTPNVLSCSAVLECLKELRKKVLQSSSTLSLAITVSMMTSSNGNIFRVTGPLCGEFTGHRWIPHPNASDAELWCFLWYVTE